ncbi:sister chromatid cohesion protein DCC1 [Anthonomus grandis grandis]|uniref:sister chromatid cohesion protein DCC1 n=1 Tax=Anthonomus grandis grandis TaxID=2921223 RepID=UPI002166878B|nr:sister chromatid cohesion protein DCC1 [Anthonomus grandis grandis]
MNLTDQANSTNSRTLQAVNEVLQSAKLSREDVLSTSQTVFFTNEKIDDNSFRLLELNNEILKSIENGEKLCIKGCDDDDLVICSEKVTFQVTSAETSNSLLLVKPLKFFEDLKDSSSEQVEKIKVYKIFNECLEANVSKLCLKRLYEILSKTVYRGPEYESEIDQNQLFTLDELKNCIQASDAELIDAIQSMDIFEINGFLRELDFEYHFRVLSYMLKLIDENSWALDTIDYNETCESLEEIIPKEIIKCIFEKYTTETRIIDGMQMYQYKEERVCKFFARVILKTAEKFNLDEFLQAWKESVPEGMVPKEEMLYGIAIIDRNSKPKVIWSFEESSLPDNINERFKVLFKAKDKWTVPEIAPYIKPLATAKLDVNALLAKHARASLSDMKDTTGNKIKYYSDRHSR